MLELGQRMLRVYIFVCEREENKERERQNENNRMTKIHMD